MQNESIFDNLVDSTGVTLPLMARIVALYFRWNDFCRIHRTIRATPPMESRITDHVWDLKELLAV